MSLRLSASIDHVGSDIPVPVLAAFVNDQVVAGNGDRIARGTAVELKYTDFNDQVAALSIFGMCDLVI